MGFYNSGNANRTAVIGLETGQGKSTLIVYLMAELYFYDKTQSGSIVLVPYTKQCDKLAADINALAGIDIAVAHHSDKKVKLSHKQLKKYPIVIMTHTRFLSGIEDLSSYACWQDTNDLHELSNEFTEYRRRRLIIDESINKIDLLSILSDTLNLLDNFFQAQKNREDFRLWQTISIKVRELFVLPILPEECNKTKLVKLETEIPKRLLDIVTFGAKPPSGNNIQRALKAIMNLSIDGGILKTSNNPLYRKIQTTSYINIFSPLFTSIVLDGTCRVNQTYQNTKHFDIIDIPRTKKYDDVTLHIESKSTGSRSSIEKDSTVITRTIEHINTHLDGKNIVDRFRGLSENVTVAHWGSFNGTSDYNNKECIVYCGCPHMDETFYIYLYHIFSGDKDYNKNRIYKPSGRKDPVVRFVNEPLYEHMRQSFLVAELIQSINRGVCRNYNNTIPMHVFLPFGDWEVLNIISNELPDVNIIEDYHLLDDNNNSDSNENEKTLVDTVVTVLLNHNDYFKNKTINKSDVFNLDIIKRNFKCNSRTIQSQIWRSPQILELQDIGYLAVTKKQINLFDVAV